MKLKCAIDPWGRLTFLEKLPDIYEVAGMNELLQLEAEFFAESGVMTEPPGVYLVTFRSVTVRDNRTEEVDTTLEIESVEPIAATSTVEILREALKFYATGQHFEWCGLPEHHPETVSGEPTNWLAGGPDDHEFQYEAGFVAYEALAATKVIR